MGLSYPYMVLKLGFGPNVSVVAAFFGFLFLRLFDIVLRKKTYNRWQNNLAEAAGTSAAQTAFMCVLLGAFDILSLGCRGENSQIGWHSWRFEVEIRSLDVASCRSADTGIQGDA